jgi:lipopolysaccharide transport system permease protein
VSPRWKHYVDLVLALTIKEFKVRYKRTVLGYGWSLLNPLVLAATYWIAFKAILNVRIEGYFIFLLAGLFPWQWINNAVQLAPRAFIINALLVKKIAFPRYLIIASSVLTEGLHFLLCLPVLAALALLMGHGTLSSAWLWRALPLDGTMDWRALGIATLIAMAAVGVGQFVFGHLQ